MRMMKSSFVIIALLALCTLNAPGGSPKKLPVQLSTPKSDVIMQGFYWNSPPGGIWWDSLGSLAPRLAAAGFSAIWFPAPTKGASGAYSMGYDPYDLYDFGQFDQEGSIETRFGSRQELIDAIGSFHANGIRVYADAVMAHADGGEQEVAYNCNISPTLPDSAWLIFNYPYGSGRFRKNAASFYPNHYSTPPCDWNPSDYHGVDPAYKFGEYLDMTQTSVTDSLIAWGRYLRSVLGFDGFRVDEAKAIDPHFMGQWLQAADTNGFAVAEFFSSASDIGTWLNLVQNVNGGKVSMFDFPLRFSLQSMCNNTAGTYDMTQLDNAGLAGAGIAGTDIVTFAENHDFDRIGWDGSVGSGNNPIITDKHLAYAFIMFAEGRPCVFFKDYFTYGLSGKIDTLNWIRMNYLAGTTTRRGGLNAYYIRQDRNTDQNANAQDIYVARRNGYGSQPGGYIVINDNASQYIDVWVDTDSPVGTVYRDFTGKDADKIVVGPSGPGGKNRLDLWAPKRNYTVYVADTTRHMTTLPFIDALTPQSAFIRTPYAVQLVYGAAHPESLAFSIGGQPSWLSLSQTGLLSGTPDSLSAGSSSVTVSAVDPEGDTASISFILTVYAHPVMDGNFDGEGVWGPPLAVADTVMGWDTSQVQRLYVTSDSQYFYFGAKVIARNWMDWCFLINTKSGGGTADSWLRSIVYAQPDPPDYILRGTFTNYAEFHTWTGSAWSGVGSRLPLTETAQNITSSSPQSGWAEGRILRSVIGNPAVFGVQVFLTGNQNVHATFDACPDDQNTNVWSGQTTYLHYYAVRGTPVLTTVNLQSPASGSIGIGSSISVSARAYGVGLTDSAGQTSGLRCWIGYNSANTNPSGWTTWVQAVYNADQGGRDEFRASIGALLPQGVYYYASRFQYNGGPYLYGGYSSSGGGLWDSIHFVSGVLTVNGPPAVPVQNLPVNGATDQAPTVDLSWAAVPAASAYRVQVARDSLFGSPFVDDSAVAGTVRHLAGLRTDSVYYWHVRSQNAYGMSGYSPVWWFRVSKIPFVSRIQAGWNIVSVPVGGSDPRLTVLYPGAAGHAFSFGGGGSYSITDSLYRGTGYWIKYQAADSTVIVGAPVDVDTLLLNAGWNLIGTISDTVAADSVIQLPSGLLQSSFFGFLNGYTIVTDLTPGYGYWVKSADTGRIVLLRQMSGRQVPARTVTAARAEPGRLIVRDADGEERALFIAPDHAKGASGLKSELPPVPPANILDVRFASNRQTEVCGTAGLQEFPIRLSGALFPVDVLWTSGSLTGTYDLRINGSLLPLVPGIPVRIESGTDRIALVSAGAGVLPTEFRLFQNYPNPFNPATTIAYSLAADSRVSLRLYNVLGELISILHENVESAGLRTFTLDASGFPSGVYYYTFDAVRLDNNVAIQRQIMKLVLIK